MTNDPFEQFERSRSGFLIPIGLFLVGAVLTWLAIVSLNGIVRDADETAAAMEAEAQERAVVMEELQETLEQANVDSNTVLEPSESQDTAADNATPP